MAGRCEVLVWLLLINFQVCRPQTSAEFLSRNFCLEDNLSCPDVPPAVGSCFTRNMLCDGIPDCSDGSDEGTLEVSLNCNDINGTSSFHCGSGQFISLDRLCDGVDDCGLGMDETFLLCDNKCFGSYYGGCDRTSDCLNSRLSAQCGDFFFPGSLQNVVLVPGEEAQVPQTEIRTVLIDVIPLVMEGDLLDVCVRLLSVRNPPNNAFTFANYILEIDIFPRSADADDFIVTQPLLLVFSSSSQPSQCFQVNIIDDAIREFQEDFFIASPQSGATVLVTIVDNGSTIDFPTGNDDGALIGALVGIVVGCLLVIVLLAGLVFLAVSCCVWRHRIKGKRGKSLFTKKPDRENLTPRSIICSFKRGKLEVLARTVAIVASLAALGTAIATLVGASQGITVAAPGGEIFTFKLSVVEYEGPAGFIVAFSVIAIIFEVYVLMSRLCMHTDALKKFLQHASILEMITILGFIAGGVPLSYYASFLNEDVNQVLIPSAICASLCFLLALLYPVLACFSLKASTIG